MIIPDSNSFGAVSKCAGFDEIIRFIREPLNNHKESAIAFGMLQAAYSVKEGPYRENVLDILDKLSQTKAKFDSEFCHTHPTIDITNSILYAAQDYADEMTIPCTEWPTQEEVINIVFEAALKWNKTK